MFILNLKEKRHEVGGSLQRERRVLAGRLVPRVLEVTAAIITTCTRWGDDVTLRGSGLAFHLGARWYRG